MANIYNEAKQQFLKGDMDLDAGGQTYRVLLLRADGVTPTYDADHVYVSDVLGHAQNTEVSVSGYSRQDLGSRAVTQNDTDDRAEAEAQKSTFTSLAAGQTIGAAVIYKFGTGDSDSPVVGFFDAADLPTNGSNVEVRWNSVDGVGDFCYLENAVRVYNNALESFLNGVGDLDGGGTFRCLLLRADGVTPVFDADHVFVSDVLGHAQNTEVSASGYARQDLSSVSVNVDTGTDEGYFQANKSTFSAVASGQTVGAAVIFEFITNDAASPVLAYYELTDTPTNGSDVEVLWSGTDGVGRAIKLTE